MEININRDALRYALGLAAGYTDPTAIQSDSKSPNAHVCIDATAEGVIFRATNGIIGINYKVADCEVVEIGKCFVDGKRLLDFVATLGEGNINIKRQDDDITIKQHRARSKMKNPAVDDFREFPPLENPHAFNISAQLLATALKRVSVGIAGANTTTRAAEGALIDIFEDKIKIVSTNLRQIFIEYIDGKFGERAQLIIPKAAINEMQKIFFGEVQIQYNASALYAAGANFTFYTKLINARFPDYEKVEKKIADATEGIYKITLNRAEFLSAVKRASVFAENVKLTFNENGIEFKSGYSDFGESAAAMECETGAKEPVTIMFKAKYVVDFLNAITDEVFALKCELANPYHPAAHFSVPNLVLISMLIQE